MFEAKLTRFAAVGGAGFVIDASALTALVKLADMGLYSSRSISFLLAVSFAWYLNRVWTFKSAQNDRRSKEYMRYVTVQVIGALINLGIYVTCIEIIDGMAQYPVIPLAIGAAGALAFNFICSRIS